MDTPAALRARLFGVRVRVVVGQAAYRFVHVLRDLGFVDTSAEGSTLSIAAKDAAAAAPTIVRTLVEAGADVQTVTAEQPPLEQVYLRLLEDEGRLKPATTRT
jgi:hypothetical protein